MKAKDILKLSPSVWDYSPSETSSHMSFIEMESCLVMVDTGMEPEKTQIMRDFAEKQTGKKFRYVIITHHHGDHTFGIKIFQDCEIIMSKATKEILKNKILGEYKDKEIILPEETFEGECEIKDGERLVRIVETHGHTQGSSFVYLPDESVLLTGDLLFADMFPYAADPSVNPYLWVEAFQKMIDLKPNLVLPGHGHIASVNDLKAGQNLIKEMLEFIERKVEQNQSFTEIIVAKDKPEFCEDASARWINMTVEAFYKVVKREKAITNSK